MEHKSGNYQDDIHNAAYEAQYREPRLCSDNLINTTGRTAESLNGKWNFAADWYDTCRRAQWFKEIAANAAGAPMPVDWDWEGWDTITVPACWNMEKPELRYFEGTGVYTRTFRYEPHIPLGERLILRFEGVAYSACVFINGVFAGRHDGASTPFNVDITGLVKTNNRIVVTVDARRSPLRIPMDNTDWFLYGGIYRDVLLYRLPKVYIKDWFVRLAPSDSSPSGGIDADIYVAAANGKPVQDGFVIIEFPALDIKAEAPVRDGRAVFHITAQPDRAQIGLDPVELALLEITHTGRWSPQNPRLHTIIMSYYMARDAMADWTQDRIGFREIAVRGTDIFLNGEKIFLKGVCVHEDHFALGKTTTEDIIRQTIRHLKEMNGYYLRLAHYPHDARFARIADEEGVLLWEEVPVYWAVAFDHRDTYADAENQLAELVLRDRNRASVILWSVGNENADTDSRLAFMSGLVNKARELDPTRLVSAACLINHVELKIEDRLADVLDVIGINEYYGWYDPDFSKLPKILTNSAPGKPVVICEFGGDARSGQRGTVDDLWTEDKQRSLYEQQVAAIRQCPYIAGTTPWILYDFRCPRRLNRYQEGFNRKGLIDANRTTHKPAFEVMRQFYNEL
jgi:beta-glucuronidase